MADWPSLAGPGSGAVFSDIADETFIQLGYFDPYESSGELDPTLNNVGTTDATESGESRFGDSDLEYLAVPLPSSPPPHHLSDLEHTAVTPTPSSSPPSVPASPPQVYEGNADIALVREKFPSRTARRDCLDQWAALRIHGRIPEQLEELRQRGSQELQAVMTLCNVFQTLDEAERDSWTETDVACFNYWLYYRYQTLSTEQEHDEIIHAAEAFSKGYRSLASSSIGAWARLYLEQYFCFDQAILTALPDSDTDSLDNFAEDEWEPDSVNADIETDTDSDSDSLYAPSEPALPDDPDDYIGTQQTENGGAQQEFEYVVWESLRAEVKAAEDEGEAHRPHELHSESEPHSDSDIHSPVISYIHRQHTYSKPPAVIFQINELRLIIAENIVEWRDFLAFRQIDTTNMTLLSNATHFRRYAPDRIPESLLTDIAIALCNPNHFFQTLFDCAKVRRNFPSYVSRDEYVGYHPTGSDRDDALDFKLALSTICRDGVWNDWRTKIHFYNIHSSLILVADLLGSSRQWDRVRLEPPLSPGQEYNLLTHANLSLVPTIDELYRSLKDMRTELSEVRESMAGDVRCYSIQERISFKVLRDLHRLLNDILWLCVRKARASHPKHLPGDMDDEDTPFRKYIVMSLMPFTSWLCEYLVRLRGNPDRVVGSLRIGQLYRWLYMRGDLREFIDTILLLRSWSAYNPLMTTF